MRTLQARILREEWARRETLEQLQVRRIYFALVRHIPGKGGTANQCDQIGRFLQVLGNKFGLQKKLDYFS